MTQGSDQQAGAGAGAGAANSSWPSGSEADTPAAPGASSAAGAMTLGSILTVSGILLLFVFFACGLLSLQYCFNAWDSERQLQGDPTGRRRRRGPRAAGGASSRGARTTRGVDPDLLRSLPVTVYRAAPGCEKGGGDAVECAVCLAELEDGEEARFLPRCGHGFHADCVDKWLASHTTCPLCRLTVAKPDASPALPSVPPEPANYAAANLPASVLLGVSDHQGAVAMTTADGAPAPSTGTSPVLVIEIPELAVPTTATQRDTLKSPGSARLRSIRRLLSFGRQGAAAGPSSSCSCAGTGEEADLEQGQR